MRAHKVAVGLLEAHEEAILLALVLELVDLVADILEAGEHAPHFKAPVARERVGHRGGDDRGDGDLGRDVLAAVARHRGKPVHEQDAHLVSGEQHVVTVVRNGGAHAVGIGVGGHDEVGLDLLGELERQLERLAELGVGIGARGEVAVRLGLLGNHGHVLDADLLEDASHELHAGAVERRVDHGIVVRRLEAGNGDLLDVLDETIENLLGRPLDQALLDALLEIHDVDGERVDLGDVGRDLRRGLVGDLAAVVVVDLVAVVRRRVVGGREHDARGGAEVAHRKGQRGNGLDARVDVDVDAVGRQDAGRHALEVLALVARVTRERQRGVLVVGVQVVRHALGGLRDHVDVHAVGAHAERTAQARRAKGEVAIEGVEELVLVALTAELVELDHQVGLGDVVLPGADLGLDACVHGSPICSGRGPAAPNLHV